MFISKLSRVYRDVTPDEEAEWLRDRSKAICPTPQGQGQDSPRDQPSALKRSIFVQRKASLRDPVPMTWIVPPPCPQPHG